MMIRQNIKIHIDELIEEYLQDTCECVVSVSQLQEQIMEKEKVCELQIARVQELADVNSVRFSDAEARR